MLAGREFQAFIYVNGFHWKGERMGERASERGDTRDEAESLLAGELVLRCKLRHSCTYARSLARTRILFAAGWISDFVHKAAAAANALRARVLL